MNLPLLPLPWKTVRSLSSGFRPLAWPILKFFPKLEYELKSIDSELAAPDYVAGVILSGVLYALGVLFVISLYIIRTKGFNAPMIAIAFASTLITFSIVAVYSLLHPGWRVSQKSVELEHHMLFAIRHLRIQTTAGVPLFESLASVAEDTDPLTGYGAVGEEFKKIVSEVRSGKNLSDALEESASRNPSHYYRRMMWQLANANKAGIEIKKVLADMQEFITNEQSVLIRDYGAQLNPLALFYMISTIIAPTMGLIFIMVASSLVAIPVNENTLMAILICIVVIQFIFMGLIQSRRPKVAL